VQEFILSKYHLDLPQRIIHHPIQGQHYSANKQAIRKWRLLIFKEIIIVIISHCLRICMYCINGIFQEILFCKQGRTILCQATSRNNNKNQPVVLIFPEIS